MTWRVARILEIHLSNKSCYDFKRMTDTFVWFSPVLNPILYSLMGRNFRQKLKRTFDNLFGIKPKKPFGRGDSCTYSGGRTYSSQYERTTSPRQSVHTIR